jgi:hypothetical protein
MVGNGCTKWDMVGDEKWTIKRVVGGEIEGL